jgi:hypothetical protein
MLQTLNLSYMQWKQIRSVTALNVYYFLTGIGPITLVLVDFGRGYLYTAQVSDFADLEDFNTNIKPNATVESSVDACVAAAIIA